MKVQINRQELADALSAICTVTPTRTPKEVLRCVRVEARSDVVLLLATDLELSVRYAVSQVEVDDPGEVVLIADTFNRIVHECSDELLSLETQENTLHIRGAGSHFQVVTVDVGDFPPVAPPEGDPDFQIEFGNLRRLVELTAFASARESTRYAINGVLWEASGQKLTLVATDGRRLSCASSTFEGMKDGKDLYAIVPVKPLNLLARLTCDDDSAVAVRLLDSQLVLHVGPVTIGTSLVEGHFPKYQDVIPQDSDKQVQLDTAEFQGALRQAALLTNEESKGVRLAFSEDGLRLTSRVPEQGEAEVDVAVDYTGDRIEIGFNPTFILDVLKVIHEDTVTFLFKEPNRPGVFKIGEDFTYVVMPVNLS